MLAGRATALVGAGTQGRRLAYMWSSQGRAVHLIDAQAKQLSDSVKYIDQLRAASQNPSQRWGEIKTFTSDSLPEGLKDTWLVVECVPERLELKRQMITKLDELAAPETIIASNSSSYSISEIIGGLKLPHERRILSAHCYWPPETSGTSRVKSYRLLSTDLVKAIELMGHANTDPAIIPLLMEQCRDHGFSPFHVKKDSMGYIYNRIWAAIKREALLTAAEGVATPAEIDAIFKDVLKTPKGPFEQMDVVGLDVVLNIEEHYAEKRKDVPPEPRQYLQQFVKDGLLGVKSGKGFYEYQSS
ncbi:3-hydroxyacyl-CoA dehydrogenase, C-terminal domain containing protein [Fonsecaea pedrosoi]|nr:3-hydroxyacyl-CoA dehydrogenase, C-terminal domain containing protein [Fonsecaea pedrosoi]